VATGAASGVALLWWVVGLLGSIVVAGGALWHAHASGDRSARTIAAHAGSAVKVAPSPVPVAMLGKTDSASPPPPAVGDVRIEGLVVDAADHPVPHATVAVESEPPRIVRCDDDGSFVVEGLSPRAYRFTAAAGETRSESLEVLATDSTEPVILQVRRGSSLALLVLEERTGKPIAGAIAMYDRRDPRAADDRGHVRIDGVVAAAELDVRASGFGAVHALIERNVEGAVVHRTIYLDVEHRAAGVVHDANGAPVADAKVEAADNRRVVATTQTERDGTWRLDQLPEGTYTFEATAADRGVGRSLPIALVTTETATGIELVIEPGAEIVGRVVDRAGRTVRDATVEVRVAGEKSVTATTDRDGGFAVRGLAARSVDIVATRYPDASSVEMRQLARGGHTDLTLTMAPHVIRGVVEVGGRPVAGIHVMASGRKLGAAGSFSALDLTNSRGEFVVGPLPDGDYQLAAKRPGLGSDSVLLDDPKAIIVHAGDEHVKLTLPPTGRLTGRVARADGAPIGDVNVVFLPSDGALGIRDADPARIARFHDR
jgi:hypothetical protein